MKPKMLLMLLMVPLLLAPQSAPATTSPAMESGQVTVRELMRLESELALDNARRRRQSPGAAPAAAGSVAPKPGENENLRLVGIYGVGKRLFAEVRSAANSYLFLNGHNLPIGHVAASDTYRLKQLAGSCVRLERGGKETVLCLPQARGR